MDYKEMSRPERRVAIARDVLKHINLNSLSVTSGNYFYMLNTSLECNDYICETGGKSQKIAKHILKKDDCYVCAKGAMMLCKIAKYDNVKRVDFLSINGCDTVKALSDAFSHKQLLLIEIAFEAQLFCGNLSDKRSADKAVIFGTEYSNVKNRLVAIMKNIIKNKGTFKP